MSVRADILGALVTLVSGVTGLTTAGQVMRGIPDLTQLQTGACAFVDCPTVSAADDDQLGSFRRSMSVKIIVATPSASGVTARDTAIDALMDLVVEAVEADRTVGGRCVVMVFESLEIMAGDEIHESLSLMAIGSLSLRLEYIATSGAGF